MKGTHTKKQVPKLGINKTKAFTTHRQKKIEHVLEKKKYF